MAKRNGEFFRIPLPTLGGADAQMLSFRGGDPVVPVPKAGNLGETGVSTAMLFNDHVAGRINQSVFRDGMTEQARSVAFKDIPDVIANPTFASFPNTDCVSCHSESTRRARLSIVSTASNFRFTVPAGISGVDESLLPSGENRFNVDWNVRNFGWFPQPVGGKTVATVTMRTANEAAESVNFINQTYLTGDEPSEAATRADNNRTDDAARAAEPVANGLTLVMTIKSEQDFEELKTLLGRLQAMPPDRNPIRNALNKLGNVHFARFVFLGKDKLLVITSYDGPFDAYIDAFADEIGGVFDQLLAHMADAPPLPVGDNREAFLAYIRTNDIGSLGPFYSAYPDLTVQDILTLRQRAASPRVDAE